MVPDTTLMNEFIIILSLQKDMSLPWYKETVGIDIWNIGKMTVGKLRQEMTDVDITIKETLTYSLKISIIF